VTDAPPDLGKLLTAAQVIARYFPTVGGERPVSTRWVHEHVFPRVDLARGVVRYYERDVEAWIDSRRRAA
jgi:hypothetical protein